MSIAETAFEYTPTRTGIRAVYTITFTDGRTVKHGPIDLLDTVAAENKIPEIEGMILEVVAKTDAQTAVRNGIYTAYGEASSSRVQYEVLLTAYLSKEHYQAYELMKDIAPSLLSLGYTDEQYAVAFNTSVTEVQNIKNYWSFLDTNSSAISAYGALEYVRQ